VVRCADCGFLACRDVHTRQLEETEQEIRDEGGSVIAWNTGKTVAKFEPPICFMRSTDYKVIPFQLHVDNNVVKAEIQRERSCEHFTPWIQGFTPKEHREMIDREAWRTWREDREEADRVWQQKRDERDWKWRIFELVVLVLSAGLFTLLGAWIQRVSG
jgi:hypothetical protein